MDNQDLEVKAEEPRPLGGPPVVEPLPVAGPPSVVEPPTAPAGEPAVVTGTLQDLVADELGVERRSTLREYLESIIITAIIALFITTFVVQAFKIPTGSMENNLLIGDHLLVNKFIFGMHGPALNSIPPYREIRRGDVLVFKYPNDPDVAFVKRVIGLPGDRVEISDKQVFINGTPLEENYTQYEESISHRALYPVQEVPPGHYFVMGDNRDNSRDSREWGFVPRDNVIGRAFIIYWSFVTDRNEYTRTSLQERSNQIKDVFRNFFTKTRWERTFKIIK
jgi:signal peptidase I